MYFCVVVLLLEKSSKFIIEFYYRFVFRVLKKKVIFNLNKKMLVIQ